MMEGLAVHSVPLGSPGVNQKRIPTSWGSPRFILGIPVLFKVVRRSRHLLQRPRAAWAFDVELLERAVRAGIRYVVIRERERGEHYASSIALVVGWGFAVRRMAGPQRALPLALWCKGRTAEEALKEAMRREGELP
jgi:hypothetical protein